MTLSRFHRHRSHALARSLFSSAPIRHYRPPDSAKQLIWMTLSHFHVCLSRPLHHFRLVHHSRPIIVFIILARSCSSSAPIRHYRSTFRPTSNNHALAAVFHRFCHFSTTFTVTNPHIHPELTFFPFRSPLFLIPPGLLLTNKWPSMLISHRTSFLYSNCRRRTRFNLSILLLLIIIGGVEVNPGPSSSLNLTFGLLNARSVVNKASLFHNLIADNDLSFLALTDTWVKTDDHGDQKWLCTTRLSHYPSTPGQPWPNQGWWSCCNPPGWNKCLTP